MRTQSLGFMGQDPSITPFINQFASQSVVLKQAVSNYPLCTPFRGMLMTGQYPYRNGLQGNCHTGADGNFGGKDFGIELKKESVTWSDILKNRDTAWATLANGILMPQKPPLCQAITTQWKGVTGMTGHHLKNATASILVQLRDL